MSPFDTQVESSDVLIDQMENFDLGFGEDLKDYKDVCFDGVVESCVSSWFVVHTNTEERGSSEVVKLPFPRILH